MRDSFDSIPDLTPNQDTVAIILDDDPGDLLSYLDGQPVGNLPGIYDQIAPDELTAIFQMGFSAAEVQNTNIERHLEQVRRTPAPNAPVQPSSSSKDSMSSKGGMVEQASVMPDDNRWSVFLEGSGGSGGSESYGSL